MAMVAECGMGRGKGWPSYTLTYTYSILIFSNFSPIILFSLPLIVFISPIILNYTQSKQLSNRYTTALCKGLYNTIQRV